MITATAREKAKAARLEKAYQKRFRSKGKVVTLREMLRSVTLIEKVVTIRTHARHKRDLEYKTLQTPKIEYSVWFEEDGSKFGWDIPKIVYDDLDLPVRESVAY